MNRITLLAFTALASSLVAQSNVVPGLNGRLTNVDNLTYYGRRGAAYPNGEIGMAMLNEMCNPGLVVIPWQAAMQSNHPKFGFIVCRLANGRLEQISDWSFVKHAFTSTNYSGPCGSCVNPGTGSVMGINCADTYGDGNNADRFWLGPPSEIDPWLGTWPPVGSYFDIGDPAQSGYPAPADGVRSLNQAVFNTDSVKNRVTVREVDLTTPGALYFYGIQLIHQGEAVANRGDNLASRGTNPTWSGSTWSFPNNGTYPMTHGSILSRWPGADVQVGQNGNDDGRIFVASLVTPLGGGNYHYEFAVHNVDNNRGGATFRLPIDPTATASNFTFGDIDTNPLNDWLGARVGNEVVFTAPANNPLNWNTIYNFGFDANFPPGSGIATIDEARVGPGALTVAVGAKVPSGSTFAQVTPVGVGCGGTPGCPNSFYEENFDLANSGYTLTLNAGNYTLGTLAGSWIAPAGTTLALSDDSGSSQALPFSVPYLGGSTSNLWICSNGFVTAGTSGSTSFTPGAGAFLGLAPTWAALWHDLNPGAGGQVRVDATAARVVVSFNAVPNFSGGGTATFQWQFYPNGTVHVIYQAVTNAGGGYLVGFTRGNGAADPGPIDISATLPGGLTLCNPPVPAVPALALSASARPILGTSINLATANIPSGSLLGISILSLTEFNPGVDLGVLGMPTCRLYAALDVLNTFATPGTSAAVPWSIPNVPGASGLLVVNQSAVLKAGINAFGAVTSNAIEMVLGIN
jgi:hypothetical protein